MELSARAPGERAHQAPHRFQYDVQGESRQGRRHAQSGEILAALDRCADRDQDRPEICRRLLAVPQRREPCRGQGRGLVHQGSEVAHKRAAHSTPSSRGEWRVCWASRWGGEGDMNANAFWITIGAIAVLIWVATWGIVTVVRRTTPSSAMIASAATAGCFALFWLWLVVFAK